MDKIEEASIIGQLQFGYVDWDDELPQTKKRWREVMEQVRQLYEPQPSSPFEGEVKPDQSRLLTPERLNEASAKAEERWKADGKSGIYEFSFLWQYVADEVSKAQRDLTASYWREKCFNDTMSAKKSGWDDAEIFYKARREALIEEIEAHAEYYMGVDSHHSVKIGQWKRGKLTPNKWWKELKAASKGDEG